MAGVQEKLDNLFTELVEVLEKDDLKDYPASIKGEFSRTRVPNTKYKFTIEEIK